MPTFSFWVVSWLPSRLRNGDFTSASHCEYSCGSDQSQFGTRFFITRTVKELLLQNTKLFNPSVICLQLSVVFGNYLLIICPIAIAYSMGQIIKAICFFHRILALLANYVTVVEDRRIISTKYCLPVLVFYFWRKLSDHAARCLCDR